MGNDIESEYPATWRLLGGEVGPKHQSRSSDFSRAALAGALVYLRPSATRPLQFAAMDRVMMDIAESNQILCFV